MQVGEHSLKQNDGQVEVEVARVIPHPDFSSITSDYNIALLILASPGVTVGTRVGAKLQD